MAAQRRNGSSIKDILAQTLKALKPFAAIAEALPTDMPDQATLMSVTDEDHRQRQITYRDLRRAQRIVAAWEALQETLQETQPTTPVHLVVNQEDERE